MRIANWHPEIITAEIEKRAMDRLEKAGEMVASRARQIVPVDTGTLKSTIRVTRLKGDPKMNIRVYAGSREKGGSMQKGAVRGAFYAHMVEFGTVKMKARPFLRPALNASKGSILDIMGSDNG
ncbi:MAG: HK97-gp10 family putative phage morphogenesis protein [Candidatus Babeliales bacterium]